MLCASDSSSHSHVFVADSMANRERLRGDASTPDAGDPDRSGTGSARASQGLGLEVGGEVSVRWNAAGFCSDSSAGGCGVIWLEVSLGSEAKWDCVITPC